MDPTFHLFSLFNDDPLMFVAVVSGIVFTVSIFLVGTWGKIHPLILWFVLWAALFGFSQVFPENHKDRMFLLLTTPIGSAIFTTWWSWRIAPGLREKFPFFRRERKDHQPPATDN